MLEGRVAVVTGATKGIGLATSRLFAREGAAVVMLGRDAARVEAAAAAVCRETRGGAAVGIRCDVASDSDVKVAMQQVFARHTRMDVLVNNAGLLEDALIGMVTREQIARVFDTNVSGVLYCSQYAARMMARGGGGSIVNVSSIIGVEGNVGQAVYGGSKAAVIGITLSLAKELASQNVRVNAVAPGFIDTDMARSITPEKFSERLASIRMKRIGTADEVARPILFLASDLASYVTGQVLGVDGGMQI